MQVPDLVQRFGLSMRENEVAVLVSKGNNNKEVGNLLFVTEKTVKFHLTNIYKKLNVKSRAQMIVLMLNSAVAPEAIAVTEAITAPVDPSTLLPTGL